MGSNLHLDAFPHREKLMKWQQMQKNCDDANAASRTAAIKNMQIRNVQLYRLHRQCSPKPATPNPTPAKSPVPSPPPSGL
uniref:Uncharacterized protein n=1 Tax=Romanomermis culicivorax TaxID=13658 RepID=A0A915L2I1_ROMCU